MPAPSPSHLTAPFTALRAGQVADALRTHYGVAVVTMARLETERDDTFRVQTPDGLLVAKVAHPLDDASVVADQLAILEGLAREYPDLPVPRVLRDREGALSIPVTTVDGSRLLRVFTYLDGEPFGAQSRTHDDLRVVARLHARLARAIATLGDASTPPRHGSPTPWNLLALDDYAQQLDVITEPTVRTATQAVIDHSRETTLPLARTLPAVLAHNDLHGDNVLVQSTVGGATLTVTGILDFGDMTRTPRVADLAVAASYARGRLSDAGSPWAAVTAYVEGYASVEPLNELERQLVPPLVLLRLAQRAILNSAIAAANPAAAPYASRNLTAIARDLRELGASIPHRIGGQP